MISDKYLFTPTAKHVMRLIPANPYMPKFYCPNCNNPKEQEDNKFLEETGYYMITVVIKCRCGTIYHYSI